MVGSFLGGNTRVHGLHYLLEDAFTTTPTSLSLPVRWSTRGT